jgi:hypothetical protein
MSVNSKMRMVLIERRKATRGMKITITKWGLVCDEHQGQGHLLAQHTSQIVVPSGDYDRQIHTSRILVVPTPADRISHWLPIRIHPARPR